MVSNKGSSFKVRLTTDEWDKDLNGWRCPTLKIPGANIECIFHEGQALDVNQYRVNPRDEMIYWESKTPPPNSLAVLFTLSKSLSTQEKTDYWKKLAIILPVVATIISPILVEIYKYTFGNKDYARNPPIDQPSNGENKPKTIPNSLKDWVIALETINKEDGGLDAARRQLVLMAEEKGYKNNSALLKYKDVYRVIIYFPTESEARSNLGNALRINRTVDKVQYLRDWCGTYSKLEEKLFECSKNIIN
jgi:hypothetical protein